MCIPILGSPANTPAALTVANAAQRFGDVTPGAVFYRGIEWLAEQGIATGWAYGTFCPRNTVSREAMAAFMYRFSTGS